MANKLKRSLETTSGLDVDTRSDSTRKGYHEGYIPHGAGTINRSPLVILDAIDRQTNMTRPDSPIYKPGLITGIAPTPTKSDIPWWRSAASDYIKEQNFKTFMATNGKTYYRQYDGSVRSIHSLEKEFKTMMPYFKKKNK